jgi:hypothetical protein
LYRYVKEEATIEDEFEMFEMDEDFGDGDGGGGAKKGGASKKGASKIDEDEDEDYGDDIITDEDIGRLMIVTQRSRGPGGGGGGGAGGGRNTQAGRPPRGGDDSMAAVINEGLRFYQKELRGSGAAAASGAGAGGEHAGQSGSWKARGGGFGSLGGASSWRGGSHGGSGFGGTSVGQPHFFPSSFKEGGAGGMEGGNDIGWLLGTSPAAGGEASSLNAAAINWRTGEGGSMGSDSGRGGFLSGSAPRDASGRSASFGRRRPSVNMQSGLLGTSPGSQWGSPRDIPAFQHPSHSLLEDNGFKQQKYRAFHQRCIDERKRWGCTG